MEAEMKAGAIVRLVRYLWVVRNKNASTINLVYKGGEKSRLLEN